MSFFLDKIDPCRRPLTAILDLQMPPSGVYMILNSYRFRISYTLFSYRMRYTSIRISKHVVFRILY